MILPAEASINALVPACEIILSEVLFSRYSSYLRSQICETQIRDLTLMKGMK